MSNNDKFLAVVIFALLTGVWVLINGNEARADTLTTTQNLYDQALAEIEKGNRIKGCRTLHQAFSHSSSLDDNWETYNHIWNIGTVACNWTIRPDSVQTSN